MNNKIVGIVFLSFTTLLFLVGTVFMSLAWLGQSNDVKQLENKVENLNSNIDSKRENISILRKNLNQLQKEKQNLKQKVDQPLLFTSAPSWVEGKENDVNLEFAVYNFGKEQADDITAKFIIYESTDSDVIKDSKLLDVGNVASKTSKDVEYNFDVDEEITNDDSGYVVINSCDKCLKLSHRIESLVSNISSPTQGEPT